MLLILPCADPTDRMLLDRRSVGDSDRAPPLELTMLVVRRGPSGDAAAVCVGTNWLPPQCWMRDRVWPALVELLGAGGTRRNAGSSLRAPADTGSCSWASSSAVGRPSSCSSGPGWNLEATASTSRCPCTASCNGDVASCSAMTPQSNHTAHSAPHGCAHTITVHCRRSRTSIMPGEQTWERAVWLQHPPSDNAGDFRQLMACRCSDVRFRDA